MVLFANIIDKILADLCMAVMPCFIVIFLLIGLLSFLAAKNKATASQQGGDDHPASARGNPVKDAVVRGGVGIGFKILERIIFKR